jgi:divalent metal cation (Fe/Co/Zn/Cd) transporter
MKIAKERKSSVLASNAIHHRIDSLTSIVALATIGGAHLISDASWLDPVGGLIIAGMVIRAGWGNTKSALLELGDVAVDEEVKEKVERVTTTALKGDASKGVTGVEFGSEVEVRDVQGIKSGQNYLVDVELVAPSAFTLQQLNAIEDAVRARAGAKVRGLRRLRVKFVAAGSAEGDLISDFIPANVSPRSSPEPEDEHEHNHTNGHANGHTHEQKKHR